MNPCKQRTVRAVGIKGNRVVAAVNGNEGECTGEVGKCGCTHAEINVFKLMPNPDRMTISLAPCLNCAKEIVARGVKSVTFFDIYRLPYGISYLKLHKVKVIQAQRKEESK